MADTRVLLKGLEEYSRALEQHSMLLKLEYNSLDVRWQMFSRVYEGDSADQFRAGWLRTSQNFQDYMNQTEQIKRILDERIEALREANKTEDGLIS